MSRIELVGLDGSNPLGFLGALGLLRLVPRARLAFADDGSFRAALETDKTPPELVALIADDAAAAAAVGKPSWRLTYTKAATKKREPQEVADLKPPPPEFKHYLTRCVDLWMKGDDESVAYAAAFATDVAIDGKGNTKPTAFHFTAANQTFLGAVESIRASLTKEWIETSLFVGHAARPGGNLRWDPGSERNWALMASDPKEDSTCVDAPLEWLAFRGLPLLPSFPCRTKVLTTAVLGRGDDMTFTWPLWSVPASLHTARSAVQLSWTGGVRDRTRRGVFAVCSSSIRRTSQGFGNFGPATVSC